MPWPSPANGHYEIKQLKNEEEISSKSAVCTECVLSSWLSDFLIHVSLVVYRGKDFIQPFPFQNSNSINNFMVPVTLE
jgi:hypothetical protein